MLEAEDERLKLSASISRLEADKKELEAANAITIQENRNLLDQLEDMNNSAADSDADIQSLTATLQSTRNEFDRLTVLAARAAELEAQLSATESEQASLQEELRSKEQDQRTAVQRWKNAERTIGQLQEQVDKMEREAIDERQRHAEVVCRLERRRAVERELEAAAGRLKGAAAATTLGKECGGSSVVSYFVKDILQDNANLQMGIVELRDMLLESNAEVENLREQLMLHQPLAQSFKRTGSVNMLKDELAEVSNPDPAPEFGPELHVHHHYHPPSHSESARDRKFTSFRRLKKKGNFASSGLSTSPSGAQTPRPPFSGLRVTQPSSTSTILSQTSVSIPPVSQTGQPQVWPIQSSLTQLSVAASSVPSSPLSACRTSSIFDSLDAPIDSSRPTSPESVNSESPFFPKRYNKQCSDLSQRSFQTPKVMQRRKSSTTQASRDTQRDQEDIMTDVDSAYFDHGTIQEEAEDGIVYSPNLPGPEIASTTESSTSPRQLYQPTLRRSASHESILSTKEPTIPTLRSQHSQLLTRQPLKSRTSLSITSPKIEPVISSMSASANPSLQSRGQDSKDYNRSILSGVSSPSNNASERGKPSLGTKMGGWMWGKWGVAPMASTGNLRAKATNGAAGSVEERLRATKGKQQRTVSGLGPTKRMASDPEAVRIDERLLKETLEDG